MKILFYMQFMVVFLQKINIIIIIQCIMLWTLQQNPCKDP